MEVIKSENDCITSTAQQGKGPNSTTISTPTDEDTTSLKIEELPDSPSLTEEDIKPTSYSSPSPSSSSSNLDPDISLTNIQSKDASRAASTTSSTLGSDTEELLSDSSVLAHRLRRLHHEERGLTPFLGRGKGGRVGTPKRGKDCDEALDGSPSGKVQRRGEGRLRVGRGNGDDGGENRMELDS